LVSNIRFELEKITGCFLNGHLAVVQASTPNFSG
jgi:hypothetical protein